MSAPIDQAQFLKAKQQADAVFPSSDFADVLEPFDGQTLLVASLLRREAMSDWKPESIEISRPFDGEARSISSPASGVALGVLIGTGLWVGIIYACVRIL